MSITKKETSTIEFEHNLVIVNHYEVPDNIKNLVVEAESTRKNSRPGNRESVCIDVHLFH